ncbi:hypothetical protein SmJEL517_g05129 [Synchytrium microbalum]|uniref:Glycosyltransferase 2-like domain-containing protein n=1 Tax=Synchytrium microbalum TaxID=1806994 RepID=A0A507BVU3_9FUNG|nr:uncharacterized protein SmJEL517_g05129 [Synchytrium microbalum]TPX31602.1 hypothetical protein SmJEL517_g05129 [Synchytrium microbalum]
MGPKRPPPPSAKRKTGLPAPATQKTVRGIIWRIRSFATHPRTVCVALFILVVFLWSYWRILYPLSRGMVDDARKRNSISIIHPDTRVVVSLTSFPQRLETITDTINSLMKQSRPPTVVVLSIPKEVKRLDGIPQQTVPSIVSELQHTYGKKLIVQRTEDYGPATKLLGALLVEPDPNTVIITVDDDVTYHPDTVLGLVEAIHRFPGSAPTYKCEYFPWWWFTALGQIHEGPCKGFVNAYKAAAYRAGYFSNKAVFNHSRAPEGCRIHDDVWISGNLYEVGVRPLVVQPGFDSVVHHRPWTKLSIHAVPKSESDFRNPCIKFFNNFA